MGRAVTLLELLHAVNDVVVTEDEALALVVHLVNSGRVRLRGNFRGCRFEPRPARAANDRVA